MNNNTTLTKVSAIIGLGNPGKRFVFTRHNIGFRVVDALAEAHGAIFKEEGNMEVAKITIGKHHILLIKPQTFMNDSGKVIPFLAKKGIKADEILVVHDELEKPFGSVALKQGGSARGHNGLRSIISYAGEDFKRIRCGIGRPEQREQVPDYVLEAFIESQEAISLMLEKAVQTIEALLQ